MLGRCERVVDDDRVVDVASQRRDDVEPERLPDRRLTTGRLEDHETSWPIAGLPRGGSQVAQERSNHAVQEEVDQREEQQADGPQDEQEAVHQSSALATSTMSAVSPTTR